MDNKKTKDLPLIIISEDEDKLIIDTTSTTAGGWDTKLGSIVIMLFVFTAMSFFVTLLAFFQPDFFSMSTVGIMFLISAILLAITASLFRLIPKINSSVVFNRRDNEVCINKTIKRGNKVEEIEVKYEFNEDLLEIEMGFLGGRYSFMKTLYFLRIPYIEEAQKKNQITQQVSSLEKVKKYMTISGIREREELDKLIEARNYIVDFMTFGAGSKHGKTGFPAGETFATMEAKEGWSFVYLIMLVMLFVYSGGTYLCWIIAGFVNKFLLSNFDVSIYDERIVIIYFAIVSISTFGFVLPFAFHKRFSARVLKMWQKQRETRQKELKALIVIFLGGILIPGILSFVIYFLFFDFSALYSLLERF